MNIILCEGKNDALFFDELLKERFAHRMYTMYHNELKKLQEMCGDKCFNFVKQTYPLIIYGDGGKSELNKVLRRVVIETLGNNNDVLNIIMIRDDDDSPYEELNRIIFEELDSLMRDKSKYANHTLPKLEERNNSFILNHPKSRGVLKIKLLTVPGSLERQIVKKTVEYYCPNNSEILENESHDALKLLASTYYEKDIPRLIRESSSWLKDELWVSNIDSLIDST